MNCFFFLLTKLHYNRTLYCYHNYWIQRNFSSDKASEPKLVPIGTGHHPAAVMLLLSHSGQNLESELIFFFPFKTGTEETKS